MTIGHVGLEPSISPVETEDLPGSFYCSDELLNNVWKLGARAAIASCVDKSTQGAV